MSFSVYLQTFERGAPAGFPMERIRDAFGDRVVGLDTDHWQVRFDDTACCDLFLQELPENPTLIHCISILEPGADPRLWAAVFALLGAPGSVFHIPGGGAPLSRDPAAAEDVPSAVLESLGRPVIVSAPSDLVAAVERALAD